MTKREDDIRWLAEHFEGDRLHGRIGRRGPNDLIAEWVDVAQLEVCRDGTNIRFTPVENADALELAKIRNGSATALLRHLSGALALHGSAVAVDGQHAIAFVGTSDAGKSTLAACLCREAANHFLADDVVALEEAGEGVFDVLALEEHHWLDSASRKALGESSSPDVTQKVALRARPAEVRAGEPPTVSVRLSAIAHVAFADIAEPHIHTLSNIEAIGVLLPQIMRFVLDEPELQRGEIDALARLVDNVPVLKIERPKRFDQLQSTVELVMRIRR